MALPTFTTLRQRFQYIIGETDYTTVNAINDSNINAAIADAFNSFDWSWSHVMTTGTLVAGVFNLPTNYNPTWHITDARIISGTGQADLMSVEISPSDVRSAQNNTGAMYHWITYDTTNNVYVFNSNQLTGTVTYWYHFLPTALVNPTDVCPIPELEGLAYLAASKGWVGSERNQSLEADYETRGTKKLQELYMKDIAFGPMYTEGSNAGMQPQLNGYGIDPIRIARP